jgi:RNA polymerase sigma factor (sigma-70 family)
VARVQAAAGLSARGANGAGQPSPEQIAFVEEAMAKFGRQTYNYAYRLTGNEADARDLTQDAFIRVFRAWRSFRPGTSFLAWIYRIATNLYRDELRRRKGVFAQPLPDDTQSQEQAPRHDPIAEMHERELSVGMDRALRGLTPEQRSVILLADVEGYSYQEIADVIGCSIGTVRSRLHRARAQLRKLLERGRTQEGSVS